MDDITLPDEGPGEDDSLSETIAAALEEDQGENFIAELGRAQDAAGETQAADGQAVADGPERLKRLEQLKRQALPAP